MRRNLRIKIISPAGDLAARYSRVRGALGARAYSRFRDIPIAVVGAGANGSMVTESLARMGARSITVIDPDRLEAHNLAGADLVGDVDLHRFKTEAVAARVHELLPSGGSVVRAVVDSVVTPTDRAALSAVRVVFCAVDNDAARLAAAVTAVAYHQVLIEIASGIYTEGRGERSIGADVRLIVPHDGCLLCWGHVRDFSGALEAIYAGSVPNHEWSTERAGSLRSLNQIAVGIGIQMWLDLLTERHTGSLWAHLAFRDGQANISYPARDSSAKCGLCARYGTADALFQRP